MRFLNSKWKSFQPSAFSFPRSGRGFTLIELLVVVAMLLPALMKARNSARLAICQANLKTFGMGFNMYADEDRSESFPVGRTNYTWEVYELTRDGVTDAMAGRIGLGMLYPKYVADAHMFYCPKLASAFKDWSYDGSYCWGPNWPTVKNPASWTGQITGITAGYLYGECRTSLVTFGKPYPRRIFDRRALVTDIYQLSGFGMQLHSGGVSVLCGDGTVFFFQNRNGAYLPPCTNSGTAASWAWWDAFTPGVD